MQDGGGGHCRKGTDGKLETVNDWVSAAELLLKPSIKLVPVGRTTGEHSTDNSPQDQTSEERKAATSRSFSRIEPSGSGRISCRRPNRPGGPDIE